MATIDRYQFDWIDLQPRTETPRIFRNQFDWIDLQPRIETPRIFRKQFDWIALQSRIETPRIFRNQFDWIPSQGRVQAVLVDSFISNGPYDVPIPKIGISYSKIECVRRIVVIDGGRFNKGMN